MHFLLLPVGSAGDVHPFVGLGLALRERGHRVTVVGNGHFAPLYARLGLDFVECGTDAEYRSLTNNPELWHPTRGFRAVIGGRLVGELVRRQYDEVVRLAGGGGVVCVGGSLAFGARLAHEKHGIPLATVHLQPSVLRSMTNPSALGPNELPKAWWPRWVKSSFFWVADRFLIDPVLAEWLDPLRRDLGLPRVRRFLKDWFHSPQRILGLFPEWYATAPDWPAHFRQIGFPLYDERDGKALPPAVRDYLAAGDPPIVCTPGSAMRFGHDFFVAAADACTRLRRRGIFLTRHPEQLPAELPEGVAHFEFVPLGLLLPHAAALVHHGGIGTASQALAAGVPQLVMPLSHDQPDNARRLRGLGVARSLPPERFRGPAVAEALAGLLADPAVAEACRECANRFDGRDRERACVVLEEFARSAGVG